MYLPILQGDREKSVPEAMKSLSDYRVSFFWDGKGQMADAYSRELQLPEGRAAWDVYLLFNRNAEWTNAAPTPDYWMHQLRGLPALSLLDASKLAGETNNLLQMNK